MRLRELVPYVVLIVLGEAAIGSVPDVVAVREGGMGLGSALLMGQLAQVAGVAFGAVLAAYLVERWSMHVALVVGALLYYAALISVGHQPSHLLGWVVVILALGGAGLGMILTAAFVAAAGVGGRQRPYGIAVLLTAALVGGVLVGNPAFGSGPVSLVVVAAITLAGAFLVAWSSRQARPPMAGGETGQARLTARATLAGGVLLGTGVLATLWGIDPSRVSAAIVASTLGVGTFASMDGLRLGLVLVGILAGAAGALVLYGRRRPGRAIVVVAAATALAALAVAGLIAVAGFSMPRELSPPDSRGGPLGELAGIAGGAAGLGVGAWLLSRGVRPRSVAVAGSLVLAAIAILVIVGSGPVLRGSGAIGPVLGIIAAAFGGGLAAVALRLLLAEVPVGERAFAAAAGVAAAAFGAIAGLMIGGADGVLLAMGATDGMPIGFVVIAAAALLAAGIAALPDARRAPGESTRPDPVEAA